MDALEDYSGAYSLSLTEQFADKVYGDACKKLRRFLTDARITATLFVVTRDLLNDRRKEALSELLADGHEIASHSHSHNLALAKDQRNRDVAQSAEIIKQFCGRLPKGYRAPGYYLPHEMIGTLAECGFEYSSSVMNTPLIVLFKLLFNLKTMTNHKLSRAYRMRNWGSLKALLAPSRPYLPDPKRFWKKRLGCGLCEVPLTCDPYIGWPFQFTYVAMLHDNIVRQMEKNLAGREVNFSFHLLDFVSDSAARNLNFFNPNWRLSSENRIDKALHICKIVTKHRRCLLLEDAILQLQTQPKNCVQSLPD